MISVRQYLDEDYDTICDWWGDHGLSVVPQVFLPIGFVVTIDGVDAGACWLHMCKHSAMSWANWFITNPDISAKDKHSTFEALLENLKGYAHREGYDFMAAFFHQPSLTKIAKKNGFIENHDRVSELFVITRPQEKIK